MPFGRLDCTAYTTNIIANVVQMLTTFREGRTDDFSQ